MFTAGDPGLKIILSVAALTFTQNRSEHRNRVVSWFKIYRSVLKEYVPGYVIDNIKIKVK